MVLDKQRVSAKNQALTEAITWLSRECLTDDIFQKFTLLVFTLRQ